jgi:uncharacterized protein with GYD domain
MKVILMAKYAPHALKGLIGGSDRRAAIKALMDAIGGTVDSVVFTRGEYDVVVNIEVSDQVKLLGLVVAIKASGAFEKAEYLEQIDIEKVIEVARKAAQSYSPAG